MVTGSVVPGTPRGRISPARKGAILSAVVTTADPLGAIAATRRIKSFAIPIFASSTLLFLIEPMIAKQMLPWFGGAAAVWAMCLIFFQCALLLGYVYAHVSTRTLALRSQILTHALLVTLSALALLKFGPLHSHLVSTGHPAYAALKALATSIGIPYFVLSSTTPLLQAWYARTERTKLPFRLFALSNLASLLALLAYPFLLERFLTLGTQLAVWQAGYALFALLSLFVGIRAFVGTRPLQHRSAPAICHSDSPQDRSEQGGHATSGWREKITWIALAACPSALLLGVTNALCQNIAPVPLLWIAPLAVYLISFILCFDHDGFFRPLVYRWLTPVALVALIWMEGQSKLGLVLGISGSLFCLFVICMFCHGQLAALKPGSESLTVFYVSLAVGGALGGLFVGLLAPVLFNDFFEIQVAIAVCLILVLRFLFGYHSKPFLLVCGVVTLVALRLVGSTDKRFVVYQARNFYGALSVREYSDGLGKKVRFLMHGGVLHGNQILTERDKRQPTTYYGRQSGAGVSLSRRSLPQRVGIVGLGAGTLAAYGRSGDDYRFYEINPLVADLASSEFTYLRDSKARVSIALGDARLSLEREPARRFDVLILDAFSGDSIPVHLLTREAFQCYFRHVDPDGILAVHISNDYLDLRPIVADVAADFRRPALVVNSGAIPDHYISASQWIVVTGDNTFLNEMERTGSGQVLRRSGGRLWTDQYSNLLAVLKLTPKSR
jgi:spermidine synthase